MAPQGESFGAVRRRAALLSVWRLTPDPDVRTAIECELFGAPDPDRAEQEAERFAALAESAPDPPDVEDE